VGERWDCFPSAEIAFYNDFGLKYWAVFVKHAVKTTSSHGATAAFCPLEARVELGAELPGEKRSLFSVAGCLQRHLQPCANRAYQIPRTLRGFTSYLNYSALAGLRPGGFGGCVAGAWRSCGVPEPAEAAQAGPRAAPSPWCCWR